MVKRYHFAFYFAFIVLGINSIAHGQIMEDLDFIMTHNPIEPVKAKAPSSFILNETNELKVAPMGLIRIYQLFISTQDMPVCNFTPSCSSFGMATFKKYGIFYGALMTSDRLQRCHGMILDVHYHFDIHTGKYFDPAEDYFLKVLKE